MCQVCVYHVIPSGACFGHMFSLVGCNSGLRPSLNPRPDAKRLKSCALCWLLLWTVQNNFLFKLDSGGTLGVFGIPGHKGKRHLKGP